ncbi:MAG: 4-hydroxy-3-methylbut-2-enyl diphosphate reductase [Clostridia bacterium]|nr:4-hydroxy-3-methylbut-2-enyl diphosphate reductase [Clostridia bacterium]
MKKPNVIVAKNAGFCFGVERAFEKALNLGQKCCILGDLIHNRNAVATLSSKGIKTVHTVDEIDREYCVIRSHGESPAVKEKITQKGVKIEDATCPFVSKIHDIVKQKTEEGYKIVLTGEKEHAEVKGIVGNAKDNVYVVSDVKDVPEFDKEDKICLVSQTTFSSQTFEKIANSFSKKQLKIVEIFNTICYTTLVRQKECERLSKMCNLMIVVGDVKSNNTCELYNICKQNCKQVIFCQEIKDVQNLDVYGFENIGIVAGASTPKELVKEVKLTMEEKVQSIQPETVADTKAVATDNDISMEDVMSSLEKKRDFKRGQIIDCIIVSIGDDGLHLSLPSAKTEVLLPKEEVNLDGSYDKDAFKVGDSIKVKVLSNDGKLSISKKAIEDALKADEAVKELIDGKEFTMSFQFKNKGGLRGKIGTYNVFVPGSQIKLGFVNEKDFDKYLNKPLKLKVIKVDGKDLVASAKVILEADKKAKEDAFWAKVVPGEVVKGKVMRFTAFGAFVSVDGFDCLAHISDLSWENVKTCEEVLTLGESYEFKVLKAQRETNKVSLGYKQLQKRPIDIIAEKYPVDSIITGKVTRLKSFGAFVEIEPNVEGLVHVSQVSHTYVDNIAHAISEGEEVDVKVIGIDKEKNRINLSIKALLPEPEKPVKEEKPAKERKPRRSDEERSKRDEELTSWVTGDGGASIADLLGRN